MRIRTIRPAALGATLQLLLAAAAALAGPVVVPTAEGQIGEAPSPLDRVVGTRFESIRGQAGDIIFGDLTRGLAILPGTGFEFGFVTDRIHGTPDPMPVPIVSVSAVLTQAFEQAPSSARSRNAADDGDFLAFSFSQDGSGTGLINVEVRLFDQSGTQLNAMTISDVQAAPNFPDPFLSDTAVAVDEQGRVTVAYTELNPLNIGQVKAQRLDGLTGLPLGGPITVTDDGHASSDVALLDPAGNRLVIPTSDFNTVRGNIVDTSGPTPVVLPEFPISTTPANFGNFNQVVASDPTTGAFLVAWENNSGNVGDPVNVRARRYDANGNPVGGDFRVNTTTANAQGQPAVAMAPGGAAAVVWAGDSSVAGDELDVSMQVYDADGNPIGGEVRVNTTTAGVQDRPAVRFLPEPDAQGRPQVAVVWRDVANANGTSANGTGNSYRCFSIDGLEDPQQLIFADGFESGDTSSWSDENP